MVADYKQILNRFFSCREDQVNVDEMKSIYDSMESEGLGILGRETVKRESIRFIRGSEMKYYGQLHNIEVLLP